MSPFKALLAKDLSLLGRRRGGLLSAFALGAIAMLMMSLAGEASEGSLAHRQAAAFWIGLFLGSTLFLSDAFFPANLMLDPAGWIAQYNPLSFIVNGIREPVIAGWSLETELKAIAAVIGVGAFGLTLCRFALRGRVRRGV